MAERAGQQPTSIDQFLYDWVGQRAEQQTTSSGATTTTVHVGQVEELSTTGTTTTTTTYYYARGKRIALAVNGAFYYLGSDGVGSASVALDSTGNVQTSVLYGPYGATRYTNGTMPGTMPGSYGYTGQHADTTTGLDYYNARYYDASAGQFASADTARDGLNRYRYVHGNPTTFSDPSGHSIYVWGEACGGDDSEYSDYDDRVRNIHLRPHGGPDCPEAGCAHATRDSEVVGPGKRVRKGDNHHSSKYEWGDDKMEQQLLGIQARISICSSELLSISGMSYRLEPIG